MAEKPSCLIITPNWVGDCIMAHTVVQRLHQQGYQLSVLAPSALAPLCELMPEIETIYHAKWRRGRLDFNQRIAWGRKLANHPFELAVVLPNHWKAGLVPWLAGIPCRRGWLGEGRFGLLNDTQRLKKSDYPKMIQRYARLSHPFSSAPPTAFADCPTPKLKPRDAHVAQARARWPMLGSGRWVGLAPGGAFGPAKRWPAEHFATLANALLERQYGVVLLGGPDDRQASDTIMQQTNNQAINLVGQTHLIEAAACLATLDAVVSNDSGLMHLAAALGRPLVAIYGATSPAFTPPLTERVTLCQQHLSCQPCFKRVCPLGHLACLTDLQPGKVLEATLSQLEAGA